MMKRRRVALGAFLLAPALMIGCGGGDSSDEEFVTELCDAVVRLNTDFEAAVKDASAETDPAKAVERLVPPVEEFVDAFDDADPPEDLKEWHDASVAQLEAAVVKFKEAKTLASLEGFGDSPVPNPPAADKQRLREAARNVDECDSVAFLKPD
jgi:hypothetical protein